MNELIEAKCHEKLDGNRYKEEIMDGLKILNKPFSESKQIPEDIKEHMNKLVVVLHEIFGHDGKMFEYIALFNTSTHNFFGYNMKLNLMYHFQCLVSIKSELDLIIDYDLKNNIIISNSNIISNDINRMKHCLNRLDLFLYGDGVSDSIIFKEGAYYYYSNIPRPSYGIIEYCFNYINYRLKQWWLP